MRMAHHARCNRPGSAGVPPAARLRGHGDGSLPLPRWGQEPGSSPQRGEAGRGAARGERCSPQPSMRLRRTTPQCTYGCSWEGCALPDPPAGGGMGKPGVPMPLRGGGVGTPGFPTPSSRAYVHGSRPCGSAAQRRNEHTVVPGRAAPSHTLPRVGAWGNPVSPFPCGAGAWGNPGSPHPSSRAYVHGSRPCGSRRTLTG